MADPFDIFGGNDVKSSSTIDDDFDALFGPIGRGSNSKETTNEGEQDLEDLFKSTKSVSTRNSSVVDLESNKKTVGAAAKSSAINPDSTGLSTKTNTLDKNKLFSFDDNDPGLDDILLPVDRTSKKTENRPYSSDKLQYSSKGDSEDIFDIFTPKPNSSAQNPDNVNRSDDLLFDSAPSNVAGVEDPLNDLFSPKHNATSKRKIDALDDIFGTESTAKSLNTNSDLLTDIFAPTSKNSTPLIDDDAAFSTVSDRTSSGENALSSNRTAEKKSVSPEDQSSPKDTPDLLQNTDADLTFKGDTKKVSQNSTVAKLPSDSTTNFAVKPPLKTPDTKDCLVFPVSSAAVADDRGEARMDQEQEEVADCVENDSQFEAFSDILDSLDDTGTSACPDQPNVSAELGSTERTEQPDLISHPSSAVDTEDNGDDTVSSKRDNSIGLETETEVDDSKPSQAKKKKDEAEEDSVAAACNVNLTLTTPSFDLGDSDGPIVETRSESESVENVVKTECADDKTDNEMNEKSRELKKEIRKESEFMDFSVLEIPEESHLNVDVSKHKRTLSKKGSLALRKRPSRRAIRSTGSDGDDALFQDSTEPKPPVASDDEDDNNEKKLDPFEGGDSEKRSVSGGIGHGPSNPPMTGGIKIPGLLEGLKKSKPFKLPDSKKNDTSNTADTKKEPKKEENNFRSLLKSSTSSSSSSTSVPSKILKDSKNQSISQTGPAIKPSDLRRQPMAGSIKLPSLIKSSSPDDRLNKPQSLLSKVPPPVASKPKPSLPSTKPKLSPIVKSEQTTDSTVSSSSSTIASDKKKTNDQGLKTVPSNSSSSSEDKSSALKSSPISSSPATTTASKPSSILSSIRPKPYTPPKPMPRTSPSTKPISAANKNPSSNTPKSDTAQTLDEKEGDTSVKPSTKLKEVTGTSSPTPDTNATSSSSANDQDDSIFITKPRKLSVSGISAVQSPSGPDRSAPRKSSISGSAYAPMGFKRSVSNEGSDKPESSVTDNDDTVLVSKSRTSSIAESSEKEKGEEIKSQKAEKSNGTVDKKIDVDDKDGVTLSDSPQKDNRLREMNNEKFNKNNSTNNSNESNDSPQKPMWGVQLRKVDKKPQVPFKPPTDQSKEADSPANWRQQLANKRKSLTPKDPPPSKEPESNVPEWAKASIERRKRLMECGVIKSETKK